MANSVTRLKGRKRAAKSLVWQLSMASDLHLRLIGIRIQLDEIPDKYLPQAPLARATLTLISEQFRKWQVRIQRDIDKAAAEEAKKELEKQKKADAKKKRTPRRKKQINKDT